MTVYVARALKGRLIAIFLLGTAISCRASSSPDRVALAYERERVKGDVAQARGYLSASDEAELAGGRATSEDANLRTVGVPEAVVDSARTLTQEGDSARVAVFFTAPNLQQALAGLMQRAFSGESLSGTEAKQELRKVPRITVADTIRLLREPNGWRVSKGLAYHRALRDSIDFDLRLEKGFIQGWIRGVAQNRSAAHIRSVSFEVFDSTGESRHADASDLPPHGTAKVLEMATLEPGRPSKVVIQRLELDE